MGAGLQGRYALDEKLTSVGAVAVFAGLRLASLRSGRSRRLGFSRCKAVHFRTRGPGRRCGIDHHDPMGGIPRDFTCRNQQAPQREDRRGPLPDAERGRSSRVRS